MPITIRMDQLVTPAGVSGPGWMPVRQPLGRIGRKLDRQHWMHHRVLMLEHIRCVQLGRKRPSPDPLVVIPRICCNDLHRRAVHQLPVLTPLLRY